jgi:hypothetical protein
MATHGGMSGHGHGMATGGTETHGAMK